MKLLMITFFLCLGLCTSCFADGLDSLIAVARSQNEIQQEYASDTKVFEKVKRGVDSGKIQKGQSKEDIRSRYGYPVVIVFDRDTDREKWVYKNASSDYFGGFKIYLFFDRSGLLGEVQVTGKDAGQAEGKK